jgi:ribosomal protein L14E/L6E/L27E
MGGVMQAAEEMVTLQRGKIVKSMSGHDAGSFYVVLKVEGMFVWIADGRRRTVEKPKKKNQKHLAKTAVIVSEEDLQTDKKIRRVLWDYNFGSVDPVA